jgi:hypothetical protein
MLLYRATQTSRMICRLTGDTAGQHYDQLLKLPKRDDLVYPITIMNDYGTVEINNRGELMTYLAGFAEGIRFLK